MFRAANDRTAPEEFMPRKPRPKGEISHVGATTNNKEPHFDECPIARPLLEDIIEKAKKKFDFLLINYCIMGNHVHLLIAPGEGECLSRIMQWILGCFAQEWNRRKNRSGHFWGGRFWSRVIEDEEDLRNVFNYIAENPVKAGKAKEPKGWKFCGAYCYHNGIRGRKTGIFRVIRPGKYQYLYKYLYDGH
jgi:REP element-mobilizing transposase RayT